MVRRVRVMKLRRMSPDMDDTTHLDKIRRTALNWLTRRDYSSREIATKLKTKGYSAVDIQAVVTSLTEAGLINEQRFTENYIHWRRARGFGPVRIAMELQVRG